MNGSSLTKIRQFLLLFHFFVLIVCFVDGQDPVPESAAKNPQLLGSGSGKRAMSRELNVELGIRRAGKTGTNRQQKSQNLFWSAVGGKPKAKLMRKNGGKIGRLRGGGPTPERLGQLINPEIKIMQKIFRKYNKLVRPPGTNKTLPGGGPVVVNTNILIRTLDDLNVGRMNEKRAWRHVVDMPNILVRLYPDGKILYSVRISMDLSCIMDLALYPFDVQTCTIDVASYAYTTDQIDYVWKSDNPVQMKPRVNESIPSFDLKNVTTSYCTSTTNTGSYSCLRVELTFKRRVFYYLAHLFIPSSLLVIVSWVSFWLDRSSVPARVTLGVTTLLTMVTQSNGINAKLPPVAYVKSIDVWIGCCLMLIFGALIEYGLVIFLPDKRVGSKRRNAFDVAPLGLDGEGGKEALLLNQNKLLDSPQKRSLAKKLIRKLLQNPSKSVDCICRALFPAIFIVFNIYYWNRYYS